MHTDIRCEECLIVTVLVNSVKRIRIQVRCYELRVILLMSFISVFLSAREGRDRIYIVNS